MFLIHPDILAEARGLSVGAAGFAALVGVLLWSLGWRWHRFWIVFGVTLTAGLIGLNAGLVAGGQVLAVGILLAVTAGLMALELAKVLAFVAGGVAAWFGAQMVIPAARELWAVFLCGGLLGLLLYRLWAMLLMSTGGVLLATHAILILGESLIQLDAVSFARTNQVALNGVTVTLALLGVLLQHRIARIDAEVAKEEKAEKKKKTKDEDDDEDDEPSATWWKRFVGKAA